MEDAVAVGVRTGRLMVTYGTIQMVVMDLLVFLDAMALTVHLVQVVKMGLMVKQLILVVYCG